VDIAIPHDVLAEAPDDESKVRKLGYIARGAAVFRAETIIIYTYGEGVDWEEVELMKLLLEYASTPPHPRAPLASWAAVGPSCAGPAFTAPPRRKSPCPPALAGEVMRFRGSCRKGGSEEKEFH